MSSKNLWSTKISFTIAFSIFYRPNIKAVTCLPQLDKHIPKEYFAALH